MPHALRPTPRVALALVLLPTLLGVCLFFAPGASMSPAPQAATDTVRELPLPNNDIIYDPATQRIYASVPGWVDGLGNSLTPINPALSATETPVLVGSEPGRMALSDNGQYIYVGLNGAQAVRRYDVAAHAPDLFFNLGGGLARDLSVMPGNPHAVAVSRFDPGRSPDYLGVNVYDDGVSRPVAAGVDSTVNGAQNIEFSTSPSVIYGAGGSRLQRLSVTPSGLSIVRSVELAAGDFRLDGGLVYTPGGNVYNPETEQVVGTYDLQQPTFSGTPKLVLPDPAFDRVYFVVVESSGYVLRVYQKSTFQLVGTLNIGPAFTFTASSLIRWGTHGLAYRNENKVVLIQTQLIPSPAPFPSPMPSPTPTPAATPTPTPAPGELRIIQLAANDLVVEPRTQTLYASVSASGAERANTLTPIVPDSGALGDSVAVGAEPNKMALSEDGRTLYVGLDGENAVRRYDVDGRAAGLKFDIKPADGTGLYRAVDLAVVPGRPESVVVARMPPGTNAGTLTGAVVAYDDGVARPGVDIFSGADLLEFSPNPSVLYGWTNLIGEASFKKMVLASCGVATGSSVPGLFNGSASDFKVDNGLVYATTGRVIDPEAGIRLGSYPAQGGFGVINGAVLPDSRANRVYFVTSDFSTSTHRLVVFDQKTFQKVGALVLPGTSGFASGLVRWGANGLAYRTNEGQVVIINSPLVAAPTLTPAPGPTPTVPALGLTGTVTEFPPPSDGSPVAGLAVNLTGTQSATSALTDDPFGPGVRYSFADVAPCANVTVTPSAPFTTFNPASVTYNGLLSSRRAEFTAFVQRFSVFPAVLAVPETTTAFIVFVSRSWPAGPASIDYATSDGTASERSDYTPIAGTLRFGPNEQNKFLLISVTNDALAEGPETFTLNFSNPTGALPPPAGSFTLTINSDDAADAPSPVADPAFDAQFFVRQHYLDFLGRAPDAAGAAFWAGQTADCGSPDRLVCRVNVSAAFFLSIEFQETGFLAYKTYGAAYGTRRVGDTVPLTLREFLPDTQAIGAGVVVNQDNWQALLEANKQAYFGEFVTRQAFVEKYPSSMSAAQFVDALNANAGGALGAARRGDLVTRLGAGQLDRAQVLRAVAEDEVFTAREKNRAFVLMQYFGYLRRNPYDAPEPGLNFDGYDFWLGKLDEHNGNFVQAEMVKAFISSDEYKRRFGQ